MHIPYILQRICYSAFLGGNQHRQARGGFVDGHPSHVVILAVVLALSGFSVAVRADVLPASSGKKVGLAYESLEPAWTMKNGSVEEDNAVVVLCADGDSCHQVRMTSPDQDCAGTLSPAWCLEFTSDSPEELVHAVTALWADKAYSDFWMVTQSEKLEAADTGASGIRHGVLIAGLLALLVLLLPIGLGVLAGSGIRHLEVQGNLRRILVGLLLVVPFVPAFAIPVSDLPVAAYDMLSAAFFFDLGVLWTLRQLAASKQPDELGRRWRKRLLEVLLLMAGLMVGFLLCEGGARVLLPAPPNFSPPQVDWLWTTVAGALPDDGDPCLSLHPELHPEILTERGYTPDRVRRYLHVGDSMVEGEWVDRNLSFPALLNQLDSNAEHLNAGFRGTGPEHYYVVTHEWVPLARPTTVVWYLFPSNDLDDGFQMPYQCCANRPLLSMDEEQVVWRCPEPRTASYAGNRFSRSPPPYVLRVATAWSALARHLCALTLGETSSAHGGLLTREQVLSATDRVLNTTAAWLADREIPFAVVLLPDRRGLAGDPTVMARESEALEHFTALCNELRISLFDAREAFLPILAERGVDRFFVNDPPGDIHFSPAGHQVIANWLKRELIK